MTPAVFLDRDGTLIEESGYLDRLDRLAFYPFSVDAVRLLNRAGLPVVVISNQSGVGARAGSRSVRRGGARPHRQRLADGGARIDAFFYCPHHPEAACRVPRSAATAASRRPACCGRRPASAISISRGRFVVGDRWDDVGPARAAGARGVLVRTGYGADGRMRSRGRA